MIDNLIGRNLGVYRIDSLLGRGGMGAVYRGYDTNLQRRVAIKVMLPGLLDRKDLRERFKQEGVAAARLNHPGIVKVYTAESQGELFYIVMEFIEGDNLQQVLDKQNQRREWLSLADAVRVTSSVARALDHAHRQKILHRDIKPANIMMRLDTEGNGTLQPVLTDLGLAKLGRDGVETQTNMTMGTPDYMSPEQALGEPADLRSDIYSLGVLLYELAVGRRPFSFKSITAATRFYAGMDRAAPSPSAVRPDLPPALDRIIVRAMQVEPARRFQSASEMAAALEAIPIASLPGSAPPDAARLAPGLYTEAQNSIIAQRGESEIWERSPRPGAGSQDIIQVARPDGSVIDFPVRSRHLTVGRDNQNDIQIDDGKVSRRHVRIQTDGRSYQVTDLDSMNGTAIGQKSLSPNEPTEWLEGETLRVGKHYLRLVRKGQGFIGSNIYQDVTTQGVTGSGVTAPWGQSGAAVKSQDTTLRWKKMSRWAAAIVLALLIAMLGLPVAVNRLFPGATAQLPRPVRALIPDIAGLFPAGVTPTSTLTPTPTLTPAPVAQEGSAPVPPAPPSATATLTPTQVPPTATPSETPTDTPSPTVTATPTNTATNVPTVTPTATATASATPTLVSTDTPTMLPPIQPPAVTPTPTSVPLSWIQIAEGSFIMGSTEADIWSAVESCNLWEGDCRFDWFDNELPQRTEWLPSFQISRYETTNAQFQECVRAGYCPPIVPTSSDGSLVWNQNYAGANYPVVGVSQTDAGRFCTWLGGSLPTEAQWEKAARGSDGRTYPWGNSLLTDSANLGSGYLLPVGSYVTGVSPYGLNDMAGNVFEWTSTNVDGRFMLRGGSWHTHPFRGRVADRGTKLAPGFVNLDIGFRCVR